MNLEPSCVDLPHRTYNKSAEYNLYFYIESVLKVKNEKHEEARGTVGGYSGYLDILP